MLRLPASLSIPRPTLPLLLRRSREYTSAVEAKQVAQQDAERAKFIVSGSLPALVLGRPRCLRPLHCQPACCRVNAARLHRLQR